MAPMIIFAKAEHHAFFFEDTHLMMVISGRGRRSLYMINRIDGDVVELDDPGEVYENQIRDAVDAVFFVELAEQDRPIKKLVLGAYFPVNGTDYGAFYDRDSEQNTIYFLKVIGQGDAASLDAVEDPQEHQVVSQTFMTRYENLLA